MWNEISGDAQGHCLEKYAEVAASMQLVSLVAFLQMARFPISGGIQSLSASWLVQAIHALCLSHMERDQAAGGNMLARFAMCYLKMTGLDQGKAQGQPQGPGAQPGESGGSAASQESQALRNAQGEDESDEGTKKASRNLGGAIRGNLQGHRVGKGIAMRVTLVVQTSCTPRVEGMVTAS